MNCPLMRGTSCSSWISLTQTGGWQDWMIRRDTYPATMVSTDSGVHEADVTYSLHFCREFDILNLKSCQPRLAVSKENVKIPIIDAARRGNLALLQECLDAGMSVNSLDKSGSSSLHAAAQGGHIECIFRLLKEPKLEINWQVIHLLGCAVHSLSEINFFDELLL